MAQNSYRHNCFCVQGDFSWYVSEWSWVVVSGAGSLPQEQLKRRKTVIYVFCLICMNIQPWKREAEWLNQGKKSQILKILSVPKQWTLAAIDIASCAFHIMRCSCQCWLVFRLTFNLCLSEEKWSKNNQLQSCHAPQGSCLSNRLQQD